MSETTYDSKTGAPARKFPLALAKGDKARRVSNETEYVQAVYDGFAEPETKAEAKKVEQQLPKQ